MWQRINIARKPKFTTIMFVSFAYIARKVGKIEETLFSTKQLDA